MLIAEEAREARFSDPSSQPSPLSTHARTLARTHARTRVQVVEGLWEETAAYILDRNISATFLSDFMDRPGPPAGAPPI